MKCVAYKNLLLIVLTIGLSLLQGAPRQWDWNAIDIEKVNFPPQFFGVALAEHQQSGAINCPHSNWARWETLPHLPSDTSKPCIKDNQRSGIACDFWNRYPEDIKLMQELGVLSCRFSVDWSQVEPTPGNWNQAALDHYVDLCDKLIEANIKPVVTLLHFVQPMWFEDMGAFEKEENISYFIRFCQKVFTTLGSRVTLWCTINEPSVMALQGYMRGVCPPGKKDMRLVGVVIKNLMLAHCAVYEEIKALPGGKQAQVGLVHSYLPFDTFHDGIIASRGRYVVEKAVAYFMNKVFNESIINFLATGEFNISIPFTINTCWKQPKPGKEYCDFIGLNYYSRVLNRFYPSEIVNALLNGQLPDAEKVINSDKYEDEVMTDMPYAMYPQGIYEAIVHLSELNLPIYITENGIADEKDANRELFIKRYLYAVHKAIQDGYDIRGYFYWTLMDNFEWDEGFHMKFGLYEVNFETQERTLREGSKYYQKLALTSRDIKT